MSAVEAIQKLEKKMELQDDDVGKEKEIKKDASDENNGMTVKPKEIIRYSLTTLLSLRNSKLSQSKPICKNPDLSCMTHHKPLPKMLIANMMPKFALNQMNNRGEDSISPLSFHSNSSSSSNLSYQKRYQEQRSSGGNGDSVDGYYNSRFHSKFKSYDENSGSGNGNSSRIIYKVTSANANNGNNIRFLKKAYNNKYESQGNSSVISNKNILDNSSRVITSADHRNSKRISETISNDDKDEKQKSDMIEKSISDETNNNEEDLKGKSKKETLNETEINELLQNDLPSESDLNNIDNEITNHLDDMFNNLNMSQLLPEKLSYERESSRFSKWFNVNQCDNKEEKIPDLQNNNEDVLSITQSVESEKYFQPIEKVESSSMFHIFKGSLDNHKSLNDNPLMHMIQQQPLNLTNTGQVHSVEELEARLRQHRDSEEISCKRDNTDSNHKVLQSLFQQQLMPKLNQQLPKDHIIQQHHHNQEDVNAFKKLLSQISSEDSKLPHQTFAPSANSHPPNLLQQIMSKPLAQSGSDMIMTIPPHQPQLHQQKLPSSSGKISGRLFNNITIASPNTVAGPHLAVPQQQFGNNVEMMKFTHQKLPQHTQISDVCIKRPEVQALVQELVSGEVSTYVLWQRLATPGLSPFEQDTITNALNIFNANNNVKNTAGLMFSKQIPSNNMFSQKKSPSTLGPPIPMPQGSPLSPVPPTIDQHFLFQQQSSSANKLRLSPLTAAGIPQRIPSPRELQYHTQSIMQNALIRKKLEEQRENFRKRQEQELKEQTQKQENVKKYQEAVQSTSSAVSSADDIPKCVSIDSPQKKPQSAQVSGQHQMQQHRQHAPSPNIFTPTSVLRKMTAEKEGENIQKICKDKKKPITGSQSAQSMHRNQQQQQFVGNISQLDRTMPIHSQPDGFLKTAWDNQSPLKPQGRPIVKSTGCVSLHPQRPQIPNAIVNSQAPQSNINFITGNFDFQQQQQHVQKLSMHKLALNQQHHQLMHLQTQQQTDSPVMTPFMTQQQQQRTQHIRSQQFLQANQHQINMQMMQGLAKEQDEIENHKIPNTGTCLSPTSNQLAKWFSPELLADASAGKLPSVKANLTGQILSLEEFERCIQNHP